MGQSAAVTVGPQGRVVIPAHLRTELGIAPGDDLVVRVEDSRLIMESRRSVVRSLRGCLAHTKKPGESVVDELIAERREEARRETEAEAAWDTDRT